MRRRRCRLDCGRHRTCGMRRRYGGGFDRGWGRTSGVRRRYGGGFHGCRWGAGDGVLGAPVPVGFVPGNVLLGSTSIISSTAMHMQYIGTDEDFHSGIDDPLDVAQRRQIRLEGSGVIEMGVDAEKLEVADLVG